MDETLHILPQFLRQALRELPPGPPVEELRLRAGYPLSVVRGGEEVSLPGWPALSETELRRVLETAGQGSVHTILDQLRSGYVTVPGGLRIGICGEGAMQDGKLRSFRRVTSLALRVPHGVSGIARPLLPELSEEGRLCSTLILSPPGLGKTTLLRDLIACISNGEGTEPQRVGVVDERGELGSGPLRRQLGSRTDVLENCPKAMGTLMLLRGMAPQVLAVDEITAPEDLQAIQEAAGCGVVLLATAHGGNTRELRLRPLYRNLLDQGIFRRFVSISQTEGQRRYTVWKGGGEA
ncbi:MAG: stage III sporulation protein AB [Ruminiclostridium sp.]|jgi:stage III sporulation protein AA|nr:stage III sporulation protein AB [Ruminiclostridium sp.]